MAKGSPLEALVIIGDGIYCCDIGRVGGELHEVHVQFLVRRYSADF